MIPAEKLKPVYRSLIEEPITVFETIIQHIYEKVLENGDIAVDVGANIGRHTIPMAKSVGPAGTIFAFEPVDSNIKNLRVNLKKSGLHKKVSLFQYAVSDFSGESEFLIFRNQPSISCFKKRSTYDTSHMETINVRVEPLDKIIPHDLAIRFIKVDAEGADLNVLKGASTLIKNHRPIIILESGRMKSIPALLYNYSRESYLQFFKDINYVLYDTAALFFNSELWDYPTLNDFIAIPKETESQIQEIIWISFLQLFSTKLINKN